MIVYLKKKSIETFAFCFNSVPREIKTTKTNIYFIFFILDCALKEGFLLICKDSFFQCSAL